MLSDDEWSLVVGGNLARSRILSGRRKTGMKDAPSLGEDVISSGQDGEWS